MLFDVNGVQLAAGSGKQPWETNGVLNALNIAKQLAGVYWTTTNSGMPNASNTNTIPSGSGATGMPYSSASVEDGYIGLNVSIYTFMCAIHNPKSVLYTEVSKGYTGYAYYGTVCTSLICAAWNLPCLVTTVAFPKCDFIKEVSFADVEIGDMLLSGGHAKLVTGIKRDASGIITHVQLTESVYPHIIVNAYITFASFQSSNSNYKAYRYTNIDSVDSYKPIPFLQLIDEKETEFSYPDIMTNFGDKVTRKKGTNITVNVLDETGYNSIKVYKDGEQIDSKSVADFVITAPDVGSYEVRMTGSGKSSSTFFDIVDCSVSVNGNTLDFTTTYSAVAVGGFPIYTVDSNGKATTWNNPKRVHFVTNSENIARKIDITEMKNDSDCDGGIKLYVKGIYGSVSFEKAYA